MSSTQDARQSQHIPSNGLDGYVPYEARGGQDIIPYNRRWHIANMTIRGFDLAFCIIVIVITARISSSLYSSPTFLLCSGIPVSGLQPIGVEISFTNPHFAGCCGGRLEHLRIRHHLRERR